MWLEEAPSLDNKAPRATPSGFVSQLQHILAVGQVTKQLWFTFPICKLGIRVEELL